ncbi:hypothetical protein [Rhodococcus sp. HNM0569]|uniref:hypothetical protein n=1 Tax=Rhodococcus sp. HNM0569 TaxID=2716340 RepID=UPI00146A4320|nr:hypothetical protein [Rhodococcus sp. HNM0569]NLU81345.1 hypothetical protein [Rhodococcus sp. HNM0569]
MTFSSGFGATDRAQILQQAGELSALGEPKGLLVSTNQVADFVLFNVRSKTDPNDRGRAFSYEDAKAYIVQQPDTE